MENAEKKVLRNKQIEKKGNHEDFHTLANLSRLTPPFESGRLLLNLQFSHCTFTRLPAAE